MGGGVRLCQKNSETPSGFVSLRREEAPLTLRGQKKCFDIKKIRIYVFFSTSGLTRAQLSGCCVRQLCIGWCARGNGPLTVASPLLSLRSPPEEPLHCRRGGCGSGLQHKQAAFHCHDTAIFPKLPLVHKEIAKSCHEIVQQLYFIRLL